MDVIYTILEWVIIFGLITAFAVGYVIYDNFANNSNTVQDNYSAPLTYNVQQRINGAWVNRATNHSENSAWHLAEKYRSEESHPIRIIDSNGTVVTSL